MEKRRLRKLTRMAMVALGLIQDGRTDPETVARSLRIDVFTITLIRRFELRASSSSIFRNRSIGDVVPDLIDPRR